MRWVDCQLSILNTIVMPKAIRVELKKLPKTLEETYANAISKTHESQENDVKTILKWLVCSLRPLAIEELEETLAINVASNMYSVANRPFGLKMNSIKSLTQFW